MMKLRTIIAMSVAATAILSTAASPAGDGLTFVATTDVHGNLLPYNFITRRPATGSLARVATYVDSLRAARGADNVVLLDVGDLLQGQPTVYYYNYLDTVVPHIAPRVMRAMGYDALALGNHDVETGHAVYDRFRAQLGDIPLLAANAVDTATGEPYFQPYTVINKGGKRIAILGLITPAIPAWLPENLWSGIKFEDMMESASKWVPYIKEKEKPDLMVGIFHAGHDASRHVGQWIENASVQVADSIEGFDLVFIGHDHQIYNSTRPNGTLVLNGANLADNIAVATVEFTPEGVEKKGEVVSMASVEPSSRFMEEFKSDSQTVSDFVDEVITTATGRFRQRDAFFGPSAFMQLLHELQLDIAEADISLAAPLSFDADIAEGTVRMADMFTLYKYENLLYTLAMTGQEVKDYLEMSYDLWTRPMSSPDEELIRFATGTPAKGDYAALQHPSYNFDSAAGIVYEVDVTQPRGNKIRIISMADGSEFDPEKVYKVAVNSYRANGGGDLLTKGAGIPHDRLGERILKATDRDLRYYLIERLRGRDKIEPVVTQN
ncbi:MAG: bifunctional metallophosphatase/5'-nucleotidase, partial [Duncaniella sp.]|nr:bifunctional metallophosphatase/5'-nucleotidase [Duncaniella sp.]